MTLGKADEVHLIKRLDADHVCFSEPFEVLIRNYIPSKTSDNADKKAINAPSALHSANVRRKETAKSQSVMCFIVSCVHFYYRSLKLNKRAKHFQMFTHLNLVHIVI